MICCPTVVHCTSNREHLFFLRQIVLPYPRGYAIAMQFLQLVQTLKTKIFLQFHFILLPCSSVRILFNDNLTGVLLAGPAILPVLRLANFNFDILVLLEGPVILLLSVMSVDAEQKKKYDEIRLIGSFIPEGTSERT